MVDSNEVLEKLIEDNEMVLVYFGSENCGVCSAMKPKLEEILKNYPKVKSVQVDVEKLLEVSALYNIFTIPGILLFIEGKETIREARNVSIIDLNNKISRYYKLFFE
jgi:thioredoxin-like negative regulator of GroEL